MATFYGTPLPDIITGTADADTVYNIGQGLDVVSTLGGDDTVYVTLRPTLLSEASTVSMGSGDDQLVLDGRGLSGAFTLGRPTLDLSNFGLSGSVSLGGVSPLLFSGVERLAVYGGAGDDSITTGPGNDVIDGGAGNDTLSGGGGVNTIEGGAGTDTVVYDGSYPDYRVVMAADGTTHVTRSDSGGVTVDDSITGVETLAFNDRTVHLAVSGSYVSGSTNDIDVIVSRQSYTGKTQILGRLELAAGGSIATSQQVALKASGAVFDVSGAGTGGAVVTVQELSGVAGATIQLGAGVLSLNETVAATYSGAIADGGYAGGTGGALVVNGTAPLTLNGVDTYTGKTQIYGQLNLAGSAVLNQSKAVTLKSASAVFDISQATGKEAILNFAGVAGSQVHLGANTLKINDSTSATYSGVITDGGVAGGVGGALIIKGTATLNLTGANTFTGGVQLLAGTLELGSTTAAGVGHALTFTGPATLQLDAGALTGSGAQHSFATPIAGFASGDHIDLASLTYAPGATAAYDGSTLTVTSGGDVVTLTLSGPAATGGFTATDDGHGHVLVGLVGA